MKYSFLLWPFCLLFSCQVKVPATTGANAGVNKFTDAILRRIGTLQDERKTDSLLLYLQHPSVIYRREAAMALASVQARAAIPGLISSLSDPDPVLRQTAAYALGQVADTTAEDALIRFATTEKTPAVRAELAEAIGKCATQKGLNFLSTLPWNNPEEMTGVAWGLYRTHPKNLNHAPAINQTINFLGPTQPQPTRLGAAHFLARTPKLELAPYEEKLRTVALTDASAEVRMALAQVLGKVNTPASRQARQSLAQKDPDYRVRINAIRALSSADFNQVKEIVYTALQDKNEHTALTAAEFLVAKAPVAEAAHLFNVAGEIKHWRVKATLLAASLKTGPQKTAISQEIISLYGSVTDIYYKGALLLALGQDFGNYPFLQAETFKAASPVLATYGLQALADMRQKDNFPAALKLPFAAIFKKALESGDGALIGLAAGLLANPELGFKEAYPDFAFLQKVLAKMDLPRDMETYQELNKAIRYFQDLPPAPAPANPFTHPINWNLVQTIRPQQQVLINTDKGNITLTLFTEDAPATVANFVQLVRAGFFNQKNFHRVVPNFVVQGGDPRGDGWGGTDYAIRSEFSNLRYGEGYVGMASAGKDTESCQWFITHSPTPHLDGRYTIFARVTAGMDVVHQLQIGDKIKNISLVN